MARETTKQGKSESLTIRLDPKTRFVLEYLSRLKGQTITTVVERALVAAASEETVIDPRHAEMPDGWQFFWDVSDGVRSLKISQRSEFYPTFEEDRRLAFTKEHWPFFYSDTHGTSFIRFSIDVLWPRIDEFVRMHDEMRSVDYFAAGKAMQDALRKAKLKAPDWPTVKKVTEKPLQQNLLGDLDDEIPF